MTRLDVQLPTADAMTERLRTWAERYRVAGAAVAWMHGDERQSAAAGVINMNTGVETTPDTLFQIGSITKLYTTTLIMQLVDEGRIDLDAPAVDYLPDLRFSDDAATRTVTVRHLLTHTSGVDGDYFESHGRGDDCVAKYVAACAELPQVFAPGTMWSYCNAGFVVLGRIIEVMTGMGWDAALKQRLLDPLGAEQTVTLPEEALLHRTAAGHTFNQELKPIVSPVWGMARSAGPAGATPCATVDDLLTFAKMHIDGGVAHDGARVLSETSVRAMQEAQFPLPKQPGPGSGHWGLGWMLFDWGDRRVIGHDGGTIGQNASLRVLPDERFAAAVLTNAAPTGALLANRVMRWLYAECMGVDVPVRPKPPEASPDIDVQPYAGLYERVGMRIEIEEREGKLWARYVSTMPLGHLDPQMPANELIPLDEGVFLERNPYLGGFQPVTFSGFENGAPRYYFASFRAARRAS